MEILIGCAIINAEIQREENFVKTPVASNYYFVVNGHAKFYGRFIPPSVFQDIIDRNGTIEIVANVIDDEGIHTFIDENGENDLPSDLEF
uniref:Uncharacterized protein n=1 Tax=Panagrolaimus sp. ES5 TaxID=591445 RepID=A0AC34FDF4_9BILA